MERRISYAAAHELHAMDRAEHRAWAQERGLERRAAAFERRHSAVVKQLKLAGFLSAVPDGRVRQSRLAHGEHGPPERRDG